MLNEQGKIVYYRHKYILRHGRGYEKSSPYTTIYTYERSSRKYCEMLRRNNETRFKNHAAVIANDHISSSSVTVPLASTRMMDLPCPVITHKWIKMNEIYYYWKVQYMTWPTSLKAPPPAAGTRLGALPCSSSIFRAQHLPEEQVRGS